MYGYSKTSSGCISLQSGTRVVSSLVIAGGGGSSSNGAGGGGAGGVRNIEINASGTVPVTIGGGGAGKVHLEQEDAQELIQH